MKKHQNETLQMATMTLQKGTRLALNLQVYPMDTEFWTNWHKMQLIKQNTAHQSQKQYHHS